MRSSCPTLNPRFLRRRALVVACLAAGCGSPPAFEHAASGEPATSEPDPFGDELVGEAKPFAPGTISSPEGEEFGISFTPDGRTAYFTSQRGNDEFFHIYVSRFEDGAWSEPVVAPFSGQHFDADAFLSPDGSRLFFFSMRPPSGTTPLDSPDIWVVERESDAWREPRNLGPPVNTPESGEAYVSVTRDGTLYFSSAGRSGSTGPHDIYRARPLNGGYAEPEHLDLEIEMQYSNPYIAPDERFLIVDYKQPGGYGGGDLYVSHRRDGGWTTPRNLGPLVNTEGNEGTPNLSPDGRFLLFSRDGDIYRISAGAVDALGAPAD